jgi:hypothetical protein
MPAPTSRHLVRALLVLALVLSWAPRLHAFGCQASAALPIFPSAGTTCPTALHIGDTVDILITIQNTSSSVPPGTNVSAKLVNTCLGGVNNGDPCTVAADCASLNCIPAVTYTLACTDTTCAAELPGTLTFMPVGGNGCVSNAAAVTACTLNAADVTGNTVDITVNAAGVPIPAGGSVSIATIRAVATAEVPLSGMNPCGVFGTRADTLNNSLATTDANCDAEATGGAQGSANLFLPAPTATPTPTPTSTRTVTPTRTPTLTPTPTPTSTLPPPEHFGCFEIHRPPLNVEGVVLADHFGPSTVVVQRGKRICAPANKNGEDPTAVSEPEHLIAYTIRQTTPRFFPQKNVPVTNQFGDLVVTISKPDRVLVPTSKSHAGLPPPLPQDAIDHYKCYRVKYANFTRSNVSVETQFGTLDVDIKKPLHLCLPANKNDEGIFDPGHHLMCYQVRGPRPPTQPTIFTDNQFVSDQTGILGIRDLCVPSIATLPFVIP